MNKEVLRDLFKKIIVEIPNKEIKSDIITDKVIKSEIYEKASVIALYASLPTEVNTQKLISYSLKAGKIVALPCVVSESEMIFYKIESVGELNRTGPFGIREPEANSANFIDKSAIDLMIMPGICFDKSKYRVGYGKGYYDRYLYGTDNIVKIGICFYEQILTVGEIPADEYDIKADTVITDVSDIK